MKIKAELSKSDKDEKRYKVILKKDDKKKTIHFGYKTGSTYVDHNDNKKKTAWIARHRVREDWTDPYTAGFWAKHLLWNKTTITDSILDIEKRYNIDIN